MKLFCGFKLTKFEYFFYKRFRELEYSFKRSKSMGIEGANCIDAVEDGARKLAERREYR